MTVLNSASCAIVATPLGSVSDIGYSVSCDTGAAVAPQSTKEFTTEDTENTEKAVNLALFFSVPSVFSVVIIFGFFRCW